MKHNLLEDETRHYWRLSLEIRRAAYAGQSTDPDLVDEIDLISQHTEGPTLRRLCAATVCQFTPAEAVEALS